LEVILVTNFSISFHWYLFLEHIPVLWFCLQDVTLKYIEVKSSTSEHPSDAAHGSHALAVTPVAPNVQVESAAGTTASESGSRVGTADGNSTEKLTAQENSNCVSNPTQNPELETAASSSAKTSIGRQEKERIDAEEAQRENVVEKETNSDTQKQDDAKEPTTPAGAAAAAVTGEGDIAGPTEDGKEMDRHSRESSLERVSI
jgi:hypothetical protein